MTLVNYTKAFNALDRYIKAYNKTRKLSEQIRQATAATAKEIIRIYGVSLLKANALAPIDRETPPPLTTNNKQLALVANASSRTIQRHIVRLEKAGIISKKVWRGKYADYLLWLAPEILLINGQKAVYNTQNNTIAKKTQLTENQFLKNITMTSCPPTDSNTTKDITNLLIDVNNSLQKQERVSKVGSQKISVSKISGYTEGKAPKKHLTEGKACTTRAQRQVRADTLQASARSASLSIYVQSLWTLAKQTIYKDVYLTQHQKTSAKKWLLLWYEPVNDNQLQRVHNIYVKRIEMVRKYLDKDKRRFVQFPSYYFNPNNASGFAGTKAWYDAQKRRKASIDATLILQKEIRRFLTNEAKDTAEQIPRLTLFRLSQKRIEKLGGNALEEFYQSILKHTTNTTTFNT